MTKGELVEALSGYDDDIEISNQITVEYDEELNLLYL